MDVNQSPAPTITNIGDVPVVIAPPGWDTKVLRELAPKEFVQAPSSIVRSQTVADNASFQHYNARFANDQSLYSVSRSQQRVTAILDFHKSAESANFGKHTLIRVFKYSKPFLAWREHDKKGMSQVDFANFLEDRIQDLAVSDNTPVSQAELMTAVLQFRANQNATVNSATNLTNGDVEFQFANNTNVTSTQFPTKLLLGLQVYEFGVHVEIPARLKFRLKEGALTFWYELIRIEETLDAIFDEEIARLAQQVGRTFILQD